MPSDTIQQAIALLLARLMVDDALDVKVEVVEVDLLVVRVFWPKFEPRDVELVMVAFGIAPSSHTAMGASNRSPETPSFAEG